MLVTISFINSQKITATTRLTVITLLLSVLAACQSVPQQPPIIIDKSGRQIMTQPTNNPVIQQPSIQTDKTVVIAVETDNPYATSKPAINHQHSSSQASPEQTNTTVDETVNTLPATVSPAAAILQAQRQNQQRQFNDGSHIPAYQQLLNQGINSLNNNQLGKAEHDFTRAQRIAPQAANVYYYLAQVALKKGQGNRAEAMARRGLLVSKDNHLDKKLWQIIALSGQMRNNPRLVREAQQHMAGL